MLVINDNPIKTVDSFAFAGLKNVKFLLVSSSVRHLHTVSQFLNLPFRANFYHMTGLTQRDDDEF